MRRVEKLLFGFAGFFLILSLLSFFVYMTLFGLFLMTCFSGVGWLLCKIAESITDKEG